LSNIVAIVGRPNVGKSTLFNRLTESRKAIVDSISGVTRDRHYGTAEWNGREFTLIDTGGYIQGSDDIFEEEIRKQVQIAVDEADVLLFVVDVEEGVTPLDEDVANVIRRSKKPIFLVANKVDNNARIAQSAEFYSLGLGDPYALSSINGSGTGELCDEIVKVLKPEPPIEYEDFGEDDEGNPIPKEKDYIPKFAIVGRPNVGKSSLINGLLGFDRNIVTDIAGTTRDTIDTHYKAYGHNVLLVDTAGLRRKAKVHEDLEFYSVMRSVRAIEDCDVCILMIDATQGFESQDLNILWLAHRNNKGLVLLVNKWDLVENKTSNTPKEYEAVIKKLTAPFVDFPVIFTSATEKTRILKAIETAQEVYNNRTKRIATRKLNDALLPIIEHTPPPANKGKYIKIKYITQMPLAYPAFAFFCNLPQYIKDPYKRFLENKMREKFDFGGVPITIFFRKK
jgi:GTP-binding protein